MHPPSPRSLAFLLLTVTASLTACVQKPDVGATPPSADLRLEATVQDLMEGLIDPAADALWDSVAYISSPTGTEDRQPRSDEQWKAVRVHAVLLIEAGNLLAMPGRRVATDLPGSVSDAVLGELSHAEMQQRLESLRTAFVPLAKGLQDAGAQALAAIDARNAQALMDAGALIDNACEACHVVFWYPHQQRP